jgi:hypothetical protein
MCPYAIPQPRAMEGLLCNLLNVARSATSICHILRHGSRVVHTGSMYCFGTHGSNVASPQCEYKSMGMLY